MWYKNILYLWLAYSIYMFLDRHVWHGGLHDAFVGRPLASLRGYIHEKTRPRPEVAAAAPSQAVAEDIAPRVSYVWRPATKSHDLPEPPVKEPEPPEPAPVPPHTPTEPPPIEPLSIPDAPTPGLLPDDDVLDEKDMEMIGRSAANNEGTQPGEVDAQDLMTLLRVFSKRGNAKPREIETARRAMRDISGTEIERTILDQLSGRDRYVGAMLDTILKDEAGDDAPPTLPQSPSPDFRLDDYV